MTARQAENKINTARKHIITACLHLCNVRDAAQVQGDDLGTVKALKNVIENLDTINNEQLRDLANVFCERI